MLPNAKVCSPGGVDRSSDCVVFVDIPAKCASDCAKGPLHSSICTYKVGRDCGLRSRVYTY